MPVTRPSLTSSAIFCARLSGLTWNGSSVATRHAPAPLVLLDLDDRAHRDRAAPGAVGLLDTAAADDQPAGREVRALDPGHERVEQVLVGGLKILQVPLDPLGDLAEVVRRDLGGHADRDALGPVDEQVREPGGQHHGLGGPAVVVRPEIDGVLVDVPQHLHGQGRQAAFGVPHRRGRVVARRPEVALAVDERIAHRPVLAEADERIVDGAVAVRVVLAHDVADHAGALGVPALGTVAAVVHRVQDARVHRLQAVPHVRQRPADDDRHRVIDVAALHLKLDVDRLGAVMLRWRRALGCHVSHDASLFLLGKLALSTRPTVVLPPTVRCRGT